MGNAEEERGKKFLQRGELPAGTNAGGGGRAGVEFNYCIFNYQLISVVLRK